jgi:DNA-directed RNA polymerase subunit RPC12/RpoP
MKIIKKGKDITREAQCGKCWTKLEFTLSDIEEKKKSTMIYNSNIKYITCPVCGGRIIIDRQDVEAV